MSAVHLYLPSHELRSIGHAIQVGQALLQDLEPADGTEPHHERSSLRALARREDVPASASTLWRALAVYRLSRYWEPLADARHLRLSHVYAVLKLPRARQAALLADAEAGHWSVSRLRRMVDSPRDDPPPSAEPIVHALQALCRIRTVSLPPSDCTRLGEMKELLASAREVLSELDAWLESPR